MPLDDVILLLTSVVVLTGVGLAVFGVCVLVARMFGRKARRGPASRRCVFCGHMTSEARDRCDWCGRQLDCPLAGELADLEAVERQLRRFRDTRALKAESVDSLLDRLKRYRRRLLEPAADRPPASAPASTPASAPTGATPGGVIVAQVVVEPPQAPPERPPAEAAKPTATPEQPLRPVEPPTGPSTRADKPPMPPGSPRADKPRVPPAAPVPPPPPRKSWAELLAGFMEQRNIRWGELVGGLLIVGPAVALVISFWETLEQNPYLQFLTFVVSCSAIFGVGLYAHHRWKLQATSRGLLIIAVLLVPLNFLAMAAVWKENWELGTVVADLVALGVFAGLVALAGRVLVPGGPWLQALAVLGSCSGLLILARLVGPDAADGVFVSVGCLTAACSAAAIAGLLRRLSTRDRLDPAQADALFALLGTAAFAQTVFFGLLAWKLSVEGRLELLALPIALAAIPILAAGLAVVRGTARDASRAAHHTVGTWIALVALVAMLVALGFAWPQPIGIIAVGTLNCAALALAAYGYRVPILHAGAIACAALVYLTAFHVAYPASELPLLAGGENLGPKLLGLTFCAASGTALGGLFVLLGLVAEGLARRGRHHDSAVYAGGCGVVAVLGLMLVTVHGFHQAGADALRATVLYALYGSGSLALAGRWRRAELTYVALGLLTAASLWLLWWQTEQLGQVWPTVLAAEALAMGAIAAVLHRRSGHDTATPWRLTVLASGPGPLADLYRIPLLGVAEIVAPAAAVLALWSELPIALPASHSVWPPLTAGLLAAFYLLTASVYRSPQRTWVGSMIVLAGLVHTLRFNYAGHIEQPWLVALLAHSTLALLAGVLLDLWAKARPAASAAEVSDPASGPVVGTVFSKPLADTALFSSVLTLLVLPLEFWPGPMATWSMSLCLAWLAAIWLVIAWRDRHVGLFAAHQVMLAAAVVVATTSWLKGRDWVTAVPRDLLQPHSLHAYGIALGLLVLLWMLARILLRDHTVPQKTAAQKLVSPYGPSVDRILRHGLVALQLLLVGWHLLPGIAQELSPSSAAPARAQMATQLAACDGGAWLLLGVMAVVLAVTLWYRWRISMTSSLLLAATIPCLIAGRFADEQAVASALRWGSALCFVACAVAVCGRERLLQMSQRAGANVDVGPMGPMTARATILATTAAPVLVLTLLAALLQFVGRPPGGPAAESFFHRLEPNVSYLLPLLLVMLGLVGHAVRERSAGYAFSAGMVAELIVTLGYALSIVTDPGRTFGTAEFVVLLQLATITAAVWAGTWLLIRRHLDIWRESTLPTTSARVLMNVQLGIGAAGNALLLATALTAMALFYQAGPRWQDWTVAAGRPLGWIALALAAAVYTYRRIQLGRQLQPQIVGLIGMAVLGLLACSVAWLCPLRPEWGYRTLMLGWAAYSLFIVSATWWVASVRTLPDAHGPPQALIRTAAVWVRVAGILSVLLGLKAALLHQPDEERLWAAAAIAVASAAGATMAVWRRQEGWAFSAALGVNLAASLVVWYFHRQESFGDWWLRLVQANVIASSAVALLWLAAQRRLYQLRELTLGQSPLLALQTALPLLGNCVLLTVPVAYLVHTPESLPHGIARLAEVPGWLGLLLAAAAGGWYLCRAMPGNLLHVLGGLGLGAGVLAACHAADFTDRPAWWLEYHTLNTAWAAVGLIVLAAGMACRNLRLAFDANGRPLMSTTAGGPIFPRDSVQAWVTAIGMLTLALAVVHCVGDPAAPWWSGGTILATSAMAGILAVWLRLPAYVYISGLLLNVIGVIAWLAWDQQRTATGLLSTNALCLAIGSCAWSLLKPTHPQGVPHLVSDGRRLPFAHLAALAAVVLLAAPVAVAVACEAIGLRQVAFERLDGIALAATAVALAVCLWDRSFQWALPGLYVLGLLAIGMELCMRTAGQHEFCWRAAPQLAGLVLAVAVLARVLPRWDAAWRTLRIPEENRRWPDHWLPGIQAVVAAVVATLTLWISIDADFNGLTWQWLSRLSGRIIGPLAAAMLLPAAVLLAGHCRDRWRRGWQQAALALVLLILSELGFVYLVPESAAWLHRSVILMLAALLMTLLPSPTLGRLLPEASDWVASSRRIAPRFGGLTMLALVAVLVQEGLIFHRSGDVPMGWPAIVAVAAALVAASAACIALAVRRDWDPLQLVESQRHFYVYAAELLAGFVGLHLWMTAPELFRLAVNEYWMLIVMGVAFAGAGLSEFFHRRNMPVLSQPLERTAMLLPLVPAIAFWFVRKPDSLVDFVGSTPLLWFLVGSFYGVMAVTRRSTLCTAGAVAGTQIGLWVLLYRHGLQFQHHPQLWLIPIALAALVAEHLDRRRLSDVQRTSLRYLALSMIYVSSTTEFMRGVGESVWLPLTLVGFSVLGVLAGILLRVRSFLYLGVTFLTVVIVRMIVYAAFERGRIEVFWVSCILLGICIFAMVAYFEKRRNDVLAAVERFKDWQR